MNPLWSGLLCGALVGAGLLLVWRGLPMRRQATLADRIAPYVVTSPRPSHLLTGTTDELSVNAALAPLLHRAGVLVDHWLGGTTSVRRRLARAGEPDDVDGFRAQQAMWGLAALERIANLSSGHLSAELQRCLVDARAGASLPEALQGLSDRTGLPGLARFVDGIVVAVERGTPLADVMRAQAQDARDASKQQLIESGGRREIYMMIPVVFLVLPVTILFAIYPGLSILNLNM